MPSRKVHNKIAELCGIDTKLADKVNADMDRPSRWLGPSHRKERHDVTYALIEAAKYKNQQALFASLLHKWADEQVAKDPNFKKFVRLIEALS